MRRLKNMCARLWIINVVDRRRIDVGGHIVKIGRHVQLILSLVLFVLAPSGAHADTVLPRAEVPVREVDLSDGTRRYAVSVTVGSTTLDAGLDTGSTGLRILSWRLASGDTEAPGGNTQYHYGSGTQFEGPAAVAKVTIGGVSGDTPVMLIRKIECASDKPDCGAKKADPAHFGIQGDALPDQGFKAILGLNMAPNEVANPFVRMGVKRWIVELPRPGDPAPGKLILNPTDDEIAGFTRIHLIPGLTERTGGIHDALPACLVNKATQKQICGVGLMDTGAPGLRISASEPERAWPNDTPSQLVFGENGKAAQAMDFIVGRRDQASHLTTEVSNDFPVTRLYLGLMPYFAFDVLYDATRDEIGLKPR